MNESNVQAAKLPRIPASAPSHGAAHHDESRLTRPELSGEAVRLRDGFGLPIRLLPQPREGTRAVLRDYTLSLNRLISGLVCDAQVWALVERCLPPTCAADFEGLFKVRFDPLWERGELEALHSQGATLLRQEWGRRAAESRRWSGASAIFRNDHDLAGVWEGLPVGDFDISGRGKDYTTGMEYFQAARAFGIECLLDLLEQSQDPQGVYLDVLGGDGYILRILEASRKMRERRLVVLWVKGDPFAGGADSPEVQALAEEIQAKVEGLLALVLSAPAADGNGLRQARLLGTGPAGLLVGEPVALRESDLLDLSTKPFLAWIEGEHELRDLASLLRLIHDHAERAVDGHRPLIVTNDISPHMFYSAGLWGLPTREDARRLSRTFNEGSLHGVLYAYGTHHVTEIEPSLREAFRILRPGGRIVVHDFLDEGQVGKWFHEIVDKHSRTGHDFAHLGPIEIAVYLFLAGFRDVDLYEMEDPFIFSVPDSSSTNARDVACTYLLGMYGMTQSFGGERERFEQIVAQILTYPEINNVPLFAPDLVYIPRRAAVATATRPGGETADRVSAEDASLIALLDKLLSADPQELLDRQAVAPEVAARWFGEDGRRWGLSREAQRSWFEWSGRPRGRSQEDAQDSRRSL